MISIFSETKKMRMLAQHLIHTALVLACALSLISCQPAGDRDAGRLAEDKQATTELNRLKTLLSSSRPVTRVDVESLTSLYEKYPGSPVIRQLMQVALIRREDWAAAERVIAQIPESERTNTDRLNLAKTSIKQGKFHEASVVLREISPNKDERLEVIELLAQSEFYTGGFDKVATDLEGVRSELVAQKRADGLTLLGMSYFRLGDNAKATDVLKQVLEIAPENVPAINTLNRIYGAAGDTAQADVYRAKLRAINDRTAAEEARKSRLVPLYFQLEDAYGAKDYGKVVDLARRIEPLADNQTKLTVYQYLVAAYRGLGREAEAQQVIAEASKLTQQ